MLSLHRKLVTFIAALILLSVCTPNVIWAQDDDPGPVKEKPMMTPAQAIALAAAFAKQAGVIQEQPGVAKFNGTRSEGDLPNTYWKPIWKVTFGSVEIKVCDTDGAIVHVISFDGDTGSKPAGPAIGKESALARANAILTATHVNESLAEPEVRETQICDPPQQDCHEWWVTWQRKTNGIPFDDQHVTIDMNAETDALKALSVVFETPAPGPVQPLLTSDQALVKAKEFLAGEKRFKQRTWTSRPAETVWVTPMSRSYTPPIDGVMNDVPKTVPELALPPILCWRFDLSSDDQDFARVPVDCVTGKVVERGLMVSDGFDRRHLMEEHPSDPLPPPKPPDRVVIDHDIVAKMVPGSPDEPPPPGRPRFKLTLADIYAPISTLTEMGFDTIDSTLGGSEDTDEEIAQKLMSAVKSGKLRLIPGPRAIVPLKGAWGFLRTREVICRNSVFWDPRQVPDKLVMKQSIRLLADNDGELIYDSSQELKTLAKGEQPSFEGFFNGDLGGGGFGHEGQWTILSSINEEEYAYETAKPGIIKVEGVAHIILIKGDKIGH